MVKDLMLMTLRHDCKPALAVLLPYACWHRMDVQSLREIFTEACRTEGGQCLQLLVEQLVPKLDQESAILVLREHVARAGTCSVGCCFGCRLVQQATMYPSLYSPFQPAAGPTESCSLSRTAALSFGCPNITYFTCIRFICSCSRTLWYAGAMPATASSTSLGPQQHGCLGSMLTNCLGMQLELNRWL